MAKKKFYAVAVGRQPEHQGFETEEEAADYMRGFGLVLTHYVESPKSVRPEPLRPSEEPLVSFKDPLVTFIGPLHSSKKPLCSSNDDFIPDSSLPFNDDFRQWVSSCTALTQDQISKRKISAIRDELMKHYLPPGDYTYHADAYEGIDMTPDQHLTALQAMCQHVGKRVEDTIQKCLRELKEEPPYVNIIDLIDACRSKTKPRTFEDWHDFIDYTRSPGKKIWLDEAKKHPFLRPLLQDLSAGPSGQKYMFSRRYDNLPARHFDSHRPTHHAPKSPNPPLKTEASSSSSVLSPHLDHGSPVSSIEENLLPQTPMSEDSYYASAVKLEPQSSPISNYGSPIPIMEELKQSQRPTTRSSANTIKPEIMPTPPPSEIRQRPSKKRTREEAMAPETTNASEPEPEPVAKRTRSAKAATTAATVVPLAVSQGEPEPPKRKRGRPPKAEPNTDIRAYFTLLNPFSKKG